MTINTQSRYPALIEVIPDGTDLDVVTGGGMYEGVMHVVRPILFNAAMDKYVIGEMYRNDPCP